MNTDTKTQPNSSNDNSNNNNNNKNNNKINKRVIKLNIGGYKYVTTRETLLGHNANFPTMIPTTTTTATTTAMTTAITTSSTYTSNSYFSALLDGKFESAMVDDYYFIDRDGQYFKPILEFLRTGDVVIPDGMAIASVVREAEYFGILKFPLCESSPSLTFINDEWLTRAKADESLREIHTVVDPLLEIVLKDFMDCATQGKPIQSRIFTRAVSEENVGEFATNLARIAKRQHETQDIKSAIVHAVNKACKEWTEAEMDEKNFDCLDKENNRDILIHLCSKQNLTVDIAPKEVKINWKGTVSHFTAGYFFVHLGSIKFQKSRSKIVNWDSNSSNSTI